MDYYAQAGEVLKRLASSSQGLSAGEAAARFGGAQKLVAAKTREGTTGGHPANVVLAGAAIVAVVVGLAGGWFYIVAEGLALAGIIVLQRLFVSRQASHKAAARGRLGDAREDVSCVIRGGEMRLVPRGNLVVGDVVMLEAGDVVPADGRILQAAGLRIDEAALTGNATPPAPKHAQPLLPNNVNRSVMQPNKTLTPSLRKLKRVELGRVYIESLSKLYESRPKALPVLEIHKRVNMCFAGSLVVQGGGRFVVTEVGENTETAKLGKPLVNKSRAEDATEQKISKKQWHFAVAGLCSLVLVYRLVGLAIAQSFDLNSVSEVFILVSALLFVILPAWEQVPGLVETAKIFGSAKLAAAGILVRREGALEALARAEVVFIDKELLVHNKPRVVEVDTADEQLFAAALALCYDTQTAAGSPLEAALASHALSLGQNKEHLVTIFPRVLELPFDSVRKRMTTVHSSEERFVQFTKGAPEEVLACCGRILMEGEEAELTPKDREAITNRSEGLAGRGLSVLAVAFKEYGEDFARDVDELEHEATFIGLVALADPLRDDAKAAVAACQNAGLRTILTTGDHKDTAVALAKYLGIIDNDTQAISGAELEALETLAYEVGLENIGVYARLRPTSKAKAVQAWQAKGAVCIVSGADAEDAQGIDEADVGAAYGERTGVAHNRADIVLRDMPYAVNAQGYADAGRIGALIRAVFSARTVQENAERGAGYLLAALTAIGASTIIAALLGVVALRPLHLAWLGLAAPALALALVLGEGIQLPQSLPQGRPQARRTAFAHGTGIAVLTILGYMAGSGMEAGLWFYQSSMGNLMAFVVLSVGLGAYAVSMRSNYSIFSLESGNRWLVYIITCKLAVIIAYFAFARLTALPAGLYALAVSSALGMFVLPVAELTKLVARSRKTAKTYVNN